MIDNVLLEIPATYETGTLTLQLDKQVEIKVSAEEAQCKANAYIHLELSTQLHAETPLLIIGEQAWWRVPLHLTFPSFGDVGQVGFLAVDPVTGDIDTAPAKITEITQKAETLALRFTPSPAE
jgi:hypothetical protein